MLKTKKTQLIIVLVLLASITGTGTLAWVVLSNQRSALKPVPNVNLHDDSLGENKDIYVENSGEEAIFLRVRLAEYLDYNGVPVYENTVLDDPNTWITHSFTQSETSYGSGVYNYIPENCGRELHDIYIWQMGGQKFYMPATSKEKGGGGTEAVTVKNPVDYADLLQKYFADNSAVLTLISNYSSGFITSEQLQALKTAIAAIPSNNANKLSEVQLTLGAKVISMTQWVSGDDRVNVSKKAIGGFWVVDIDGWCYWANPLQSGEATGLLLNSLTRTGLELDYSHNYGVEAWLQAVTITDEDGGFDQYSENGNTITDSARLLLVLATGDYILTADEKEKYYVYKAQGHYTNAFRRVDPTAGPIICGGDDGLPGTPDDILPGAIYELLVPGDTEKTAFTFTEVVIGANQKAYFKLTDAKGNICYFGDPLTMGNGKLHKPASMYGDDVLLWAGTDERIGTLDDTTEKRWKVGANNDWYYYAGNNVYYKVATDGDYKPSKILREKPEYICAGKDLNIGTGYDIMYNDASEYVMRTRSSVQTYVGGSLVEVIVYGIELGANNKFYLQLGKRAGSEVIGDIYFIDSGADLMLGTADDALYSSGQDLIIGTEDDLPLAVDDVDFITPFGIDEAYVD